jgi:hypothetical protein
VTADDADRSGERVGLREDLRRAGGDVVTAAGRDVAAEDARRFTYPALDLSIFAVPHQALVGAERPALRPDGPERNQVRVIHGEFEGVIMGDRDFAEYGGAQVSAADLGAAEWTYVAFGHYHVQRRIAARAWYAGALDYVSTNVWGELREESDHGIRGKGWLLADLATGEVEARGVGTTRQFIDLPAIEWVSQSAAELNAEIAARVASIEGGLADQVVRLVVHDVPRHVSRELDYTAIRAFKAEALHFHLDTRRPEVRRETGMGAPGRRRIGFEAETTLNRKDFGLNWNAALETGGFLVGDEVKITLSIQAVAQ